MSEKSGTSLMWLFMAVIIGCIAYIQYGTATAVAAYVLANICMGISCILSIIPIIGILFTYMAATFIGTHILAAAGLATGTTLFYAILGYNMLIAFIACSITTIGLLKLAFD
jgi:hypothetical protein